jgi:NADH-quinone oxidoreductase subunit L
MEGPTPVSALIHAATMVTAGVYMVARSAAIYSHAPKAMLVVAVVGALTAIMAASIGLVQNDIKRVLAYSTVSQLGYMFLACGVGAFTAGVFHLMTHAFFKALLFLGSGSVIHGMNHEQDMRRMGGLRKYMPITFATMLTGWLAISGIPIFAGFFSKDEILWKTWSTGAAAIPEPWGKILWGVGAVTALLTAVYMTRLMVLTFWGEERFRETHAGAQADEAHAHASAEGAKPHDAALPSAGDRPHHMPGAGLHETHDLPAHAGVYFDDEEEDAHKHHGPVTPHESPWSMTAPLIVLAILSTFGGLVGVPYALSSLVGLGDVNVFEHTLEPVVAHPGGHAAAADHGTTSATSAGGEAHGVEMLSPAPQPHDGASPVTVAAGGPVEPALTPAAHDPHEVSMERLFTLVSVVVAALGIGIGWTVFRRRPLLKMPRILENKYYVDEAYDAVVIEPVEAGSRTVLWRFFDLGVIDGLVNGTGRLVSQVGGVLRYLQPGFVRSYAAIILLGALAVIGYFAYSAYNVLRYMR